MKNKVLFTLSIFAFTLSACGNIKTIKFDKYSHRVSYEQFILEYSQSPIQSLLLVDSSMEGSSYVGVETNETIRAFDKTVLSDVESVSENNYSFKFDAENNRAYSYEKEEVTRSVSGATGTKQTVSSLKAKRYYQMHQFEEEEPEQLISIDKDQKVYYLLYGENAGDYAMYKSVNGILSFSILMAIFPLMTDEYKLTTDFYIDDKIYTVTHKSTENVVVTDTDGNTIAYREEATDVIYQFDVSKENVVKFRSTNTVTLTSRYAKAYSGHEKDERVVSTTKTNQNTNIYLKDITLNEVDVSSYAFRDEDLGDI